MAYLDTYNVPLTQSTAAHLLRRATFGPTKSEIQDFVGKSAQESVDLLISNAFNYQNPPDPVEMDSSRSDAGQEFLGKPFVAERNIAYTTYIQYWWIGLMVEPSGRPSVLDKLTAFWQNHFVATATSAEDYRLVNKYLRFLRSNALGNFRDLAVGITKDPAMLTFQNGNENTKEHPNENYGRELQELFTVGQMDPLGNYNYTEQDVKAAAQVLTGWQVINRAKAGSTSVDVVFTPERHDISDKSFSSKYNNRVIVGRSGVDAGHYELSELIEMLINHPESAKFICRKLYRWYVNPNINQEIEEQVIAPLATFFSSEANNFQIAPVLKKLLTSSVFFANVNIGSLIKSPAELMIGTFRFYGLPMPSIKIEYSAFQKTVQFLAHSMKLQQLTLLDQPSVFGSVAYYQTGYSKNWINETTIGIRGARTDLFVYPQVTVKPGVTLAIDILGKLRAIQPSFLDLTLAPPITCEQVLQEFSEHLFAHELSQAQKDFLIDVILMMNSSPRTTWEKEWNAFRAAPNDTSRQNAILWRCRALIKYMLRMAEYQIF